MICKKCKKDFPALQEHHLWCKFMDNKKGNAFGEFPSRVNLCNLCHEDIKLEVVIPILNKKARTLKYSKSEYWLWKMILLIDREDTIKEIVEKSWGWINGTDTKTITD